MSLTFSHFGICVSDLEQSLRFYCDGLGFTVAESHEVGNEFSGLMEFDQVRLHSRMLRRDGMTLELLSFDEPEAFGPTERRPINQLGLTHMALRVDDVEAVAETIELHGGHVIRLTRTTFDVSGVTIDFMYCTDPDGVRIELMQIPS